MNIYESIESAFLKHGPGYVPDEWAAWQNALAHYEHVKKDTESGAGVAFAAQHRKPINGFDALIAIEDQELRLLARAKRSNGALLQTVRDLREIAIKKFAVEVAAYSTWGESVWPEPQWRTRLKAEQVDTYLRKTGQGKYKIG